MQMLIDQNRDAASARESAQYSPYRPASLNHGIARSRPDFFEHRVENGIVERARQHRVRVELQCVRQRVNLPIAEVPGEKEDATPLLQHLPDAVLAFGFDRCEHLLA